MTHSIKFLFHINASKEKVFEALTTINGLKHWWTTDTEGDSSAGGIIKFRFADAGGPDMKVSEINPFDMVKWECIESPHGWKGHLFSFKLDENEGKTRIRFSHDGFIDNGDPIAMCTTGWARYMESLRQYCQNGKGESFGSEGYRK